MQLLNFKTIPDTALSVCKLPCYIQYSAAGLHSYKQNKLSGILMVDSKK